VCISLLATAFTFLHADWTHVLLFILALVAQHSVALEDIDLDSGRRLISDFEGPADVVDGDVPAKKPWYKNPKKLASRILA
jgi:hypothetical protein